jgi:hypothetical protein
MPGWMSSKLKQTRDPANPKLKKYDGLIMVFPFQKHGNGFEINTTLIIMT